MRNKMIVIIAVVVVLFAFLFFAVQAKNKKAIDGENPYGKDKLHQATIDQLKDPNYQNQIIPEKLAEELNNKQDVTVYFYDPLCVHCLNTTPLLVPLAEEYNIDIKKLNLREFREQWDTYHIEGTPTLIHFANGEEVARIDGERSKEEFTQFFNQYILDE